MARLYLGYAGEGGNVSNLRLMARSGVAMVVVENATVDFGRGSGFNRTIRADTDDNLDGLKSLAETIKQEGALACLQINHAGRLAGVPDAVAPSAESTFGRIPNKVAADRPEFREFIATEQRQRYNRRNFFRPGKTYHGNRENYG